MSEHTEVLAAGRRATLVRRPGGFEVHATGADQVEWFPDTEQGSDDAWDRYRQLSWARRAKVDALTWVVIVAGVAWVATALGLAIFTVTDVQGKGLNVALSVARFYRIAMALFVVTATVSIVRSLSRAAAR